MSLSAAAPSRSAATSSTQPVALSRRVAALLLEVLGIPGSGLLTLKDYRAAGAHLAITILAGGGLILAALRGSVPLLWLTGGVLIARPLVAAVQCVRAQGEGMKWSFVASVAVVSLMSFQLRPEFVRKYWVEAFKIPSASMVPAIGVGDQIFVAKGRPPAAGDIVVYRSGEKQLPYAKRVVAVGPASVRVEGSRVSVDGQPLPQEKVEAPCPVDEPCTVAEESTGATRYRVLVDDAAPAETHEARLAPGQLYLLGDHRNGSHDSRHHGPVSPEQVVGVMTMVWWEGE